MRTRCRVISLLYLLALQLLSACSPVANVVKEDTFDVATINDKKIAVLPFINDRLRARAVSEWVASLLSSQLQVEVISPASVEIKLRDLKRPLRYSLELAEPEKKSVPGFYPELVQIRIKNSAVEFKIKRFPTEDLQALGRLLGVTGVVDGYVRPYVDMSRYLIVSLRYIDVASGKVMLETEYAGVAYSHSNFMVDAEQISSEAVALFVASLFAGQHPVNKIK